MERERYSVQVQVILVGSKHQKQVMVRAPLAHVRQAVASFLSTELQPKEFSTGSTGFYGRGIVEVDLEVPA